jgi:hypothetical protein
MKKVYIIENMKFRGTFWDGHNAKVVYMMAKFFNSPAEAETEVETKVPPGDYGIRPVLIKE